MVEFKVYLRGKYIDSVFYTGNMTVSEVKKSLIDHDNYNPNITVKKARKSGGKKKK